MISKAIGKQFPDLEPLIHTALDFAADTAWGIVSELANQVGDKIEEVGQIFADMLKAVVNFYTTMGAGLVELMAAVAQGNLQDIARIAFVMVADAIGLPGDEMWEIVEKAGDQMVNITQDPISFVSNLIQTLLQGGQQFIQNILVHIQKGLLNWLFGLVEGEGIEIPTAFTKAAIFKLLMQSVGLTYEYVRERIVMHVGEENAERMEAVLMYFKLLFEKGPEAVYNEMKKDGEDQQAVLMDEIQNWVVETVVAKAMEKITTMLIPGAGLAASLMALWDTIQFFKENAQQVADLIAAVTDSVEDIAAGKIGESADFVEQTMEDAMPLVFGWMSEMVGAGDPAEKIAEIIDTMRTPVNMAVDKTVETVMGAGSAAYGKAKAGFSELLSWKKPVVLGDEQHTLRFREGKGQPVLGLNSVWKPMAEWISDARTWLDETNGEEASEGLDRTALEKLLNEISQAYAGMSSPMQTDGDGNKLGKNRGNSTQKSTSQNTEEENPSSEQFKAIGQLIIKFGKQTGGAYSLKNKSDEVGVDATKLGSLEQELVKAIPTVFKNTTTRPKEDAKKELAKVSGVELKSVARRILVLRKKGYLFPAYIEGANSPTLNQIKSLSNDPDCREEELLSSKDKDERLTLYVDSLANKFNKSGTNHEKRFKTLDYLLKTEFKEGEIEERKGNIEKLIELMKNKSAARYFCETSVRQGGKHENVLTSSTVEGYLRNFQQRLNNLERPLKTTYGELQEKTLVPTQNVILKANYTEEFYDPETDKVETLTLQSHHPTSFKHIRWLDDEKECSATVGSPAYHKELLQVVKTQENYHDMIEEFKNVNEKHLASGEEIKKVDWKKRGPQVFTTSTGTELWFDEEIGWKRIALLADFRKEKVMKVLKHARQFVSEEEGKEESQSIETYEDSDDYIAAHEAKEPETESNPKEGKTETPRHRKRLNRPQKLDTETPKSKKLKLDPEHGQGSGKQSQNRSQQEQERSNTNTRKRKPPRRKRGEENNKRGRKSQKEEAMNMQI